MQEWFLNEQIKCDDVEFINGSGIDYTISDPALLSSDDSGWCNYDTGQRFVTPTMRITFNVTSKRDVHVLKLKFGNAIIPLTIIADELPE